MIQPTEEQLRAVEKFRTGRPLKISAFAGTGKTSTLTLMARSRPDRGMYLAFSKAIATDASGKFPKSVDCRTTHSLAYRAVISKYKASSRLSTSLTPTQLADTLDYRPRNFGNMLLLTHAQQAHLVLGTIKRFCQSSERAITDAHVPSYGRLLSVPPQLLAEVRRWVRDQAIAIWRRMTDPADSLPMGHDGYLKLWALGEPVLNAQYIMLDEAQDTNQVVLGVLRKQRSQIVYVGDRHQQIYEWRGAVNAMDEMQGFEETYLTQSFRFGPLIADVASKVLRTLGEPNVLRGNPAIRSSIEKETTRTDAVLARTNATVMLEAMDAIAAGQAAFILGGTGELRNLLGDVFRLERGEPAISPQFFGFKNWREVVEFSENEEGEDIRSFVQMVEKHGASRIWDALQSLHADEASADVILSTAHKAKGREWRSVRLAADFASSRAATDREQNESETRLFYVAMTRAREVLAVEQATLDQFTGEAAAAKPAAAPPPVYSVAPVTNVPSPAGRRDPSLGIREIPRAPREESPESKRSFWKRIFGE